MIWTTSSNVLQASTDFGPPKNSQAARMFSGNVSDCIQAPSATRPSYWSMRDLPNRVFKANIFKYGPTWRLLFFFLRGQNGTQHCGICVVVPRLNRRTVCCSLRSPSRTVINTKQKNAKHKRGKYLLYYP